MSVLVGGVEVHFKTVDADGRAISIAGVFVADVVDSDKSLVLVPHGSLPGCIDTVMVASTSGTLLRAHVASVITKDITVGVKRGLVLFSEELSKESVLTLTAIGKDAYITASESEGASREMAQMKKQQSRLEEMLVAQGRMLGELVGQSSSPSALGASASAKKKGSKKLKPDAMLKPDSDDGYEAAGSGRRKAEKKAKPSKLLAAVDKSQLWKPQALEEENFDESEEEEALSQSENSDASVDLDGMVKQLGSGDASAAANVNTMLQLQMLKELKKLRKKGSSGSDAGGGKCKGFRGLHRMRARMRKYPLKIVRRYRCKVKEHLGITDPRMPWKYTDWAKRHRSSFGRMKGLWRVFHVLCEILDALDPANARQVNWATALTVQGLKALLQVAFDGGTWATACLLLPIPDPMGKSEFGGDEEELEAIYDQRKALTALKKQAKDAVGSEDEDAHEGKKKEEKPKGLGKGKDV